MNTFNSIQIIGDDKIVGSGNDQILEYDARGYITRLRGPSIPTTTATGYAKDCIFIKTDSSGTKIYFNTGDESSCLFSPLDLDSIKITTVNLSADNIKGLYTTPITLVPAITGYTIVVDEIALKMTTTATQFADGGNLEFRYTDASGDKVTADIADSVVTAAVGTSYTIVKGIEASVTGVVSSPIIITNATKAFATGTGTGVVTIRWHYI